MTKTKLGVLFMALLIVAASAMAGTAQNAAAPEKGAIKQVPITNSDPGSGAQMYKDYCAACHGTNGKGAGPAASYLKAPLPDLTTMAQRNGGAYPDVKVSSMLRFGDGSQAHGAADMPVWGPLFRAQRPLDEAIVKQRIANLVDYLGSLQQK